MKKEKQDLDQVHASNLVAVKQYMSNWKTDLDSMGIWVREPSSGLYDSIAFSLLNKAFRLSGACICLLESGFTDEAYGLSRSVLECAINLRYLTLDPGKLDPRACNFLEFDHIERKHFLKLCRERIKRKEDLARIEAKAKAEGIDARWPDPKKARISDWKKIEGSWDGFKIVTDTHPLDAELNVRCPILAHYDVAYRAASAMVHCSIRALDNTLALSSFPFKVTEGMKIRYDHRFEPLMTILAGLYLSVRYTLYGANLDCPAKFDASFEEADRKLHYEQQASLAE